MARHNKKRARALTRNRRSGNRKKTNRNNRVPSRGNNLKIHTQELFFSAKDAPKIEAILRRSEAIFGNRINLKSDGNGSVSFVIETGEIEPA